MIERTLDMQFDELIVGANLGALCHSYFSKIPFVFIKPILPPRFNLDGESIEEIEKYKKLSLILPLINYSPFSNLVYSIRLEDNDLIKISTKNGFVVSIKFNKLYVYNDKELIGLPPPKNKSGEKNLVLDWFDINTGGYTDLSKIESGDEFVKTIFLYGSGRVPYTGKDAVALSIIDDKNLNEFEYSQTVSKIKSRKMMKEAGINGKWDKQKGKHKLVGLTSNRREVFQLYHNIYDPISPNIYTPDIIKNIDQTYAHDDQLETIIKSYGITI